MTNLIRCSKCGLELPIKLDKCFKFVWFRYRYKGEEPYHVDSDFNIDLCLSCFDDFKKWLKQKGKVNK